MLHYESLYTRSMNTVIHEFGFESIAYTILPGAMSYYCEEHLSNFSGSKTITDIAANYDHVHQEDIDILENRFFKYQIILPKEQTKASKVILLFHGLNEKDWDKYYPWAEAMATGTGSAVVLFPIAFHMQRTPEYWSNKRAMYQLSAIRKSNHPLLVHSTLSNVAISMRLHAMPQRFIWSGLQTYFDVIQWITQCKKGEHPLIAKDFTFDIFAFSIGGFLAQILKLANHRNFFDRSKVCLFCSGPTLNRLSPVSKFILDSEANIALYSFLIEHLDKVMENDKRLHHYIHEDHKEGKVFYAMLEYQKLRTFREDLLKKYASQFYAITLKKDQVIPSFEVINTLQGAFRDIPIIVEELDFNRAYIHENPFPSDLLNNTQIQEDMNTVFQKFCHFYNT